ncbi:uncharacterized protein [Rutidosis leptorrhynchoides]|uniref:uncharacterized protein n=1 Tax=Rutidosis leptorrhynchoides TaxID=125765 RepID=UPI003A999DBE
MTIRKNLMKQIPEAQQETLKEDNVKAEMIKWLDKMFEVQENGTRYFIGHIWVLKFSELRNLVLDEAHMTRYSNPPRSEMMYHDLMEQYWRPNLKTHIATYVARCLTYSKVKAEHQKPSVDRLMKSAYFLPIKEIDKMERLARLYLKEIVSRHGVLISIISD